MELPTAPPPLERLPLHLLEYICEFVPRPSLRSLSLTNRLCYHGSMPRRLSRLKLVATGRQNLRDDLVRLEALLSEGGRFRHVRRVVVSGFMHDDDGAGTEIGLAEARYWSRAARAVESGDQSDGDSDMEIDRADRGEGTPAPRSSPALTESEKLAQNEAWLPFARFLGRLPGLADLVYACTHQLPTCVLAALHEHHPRSRLHMPAFSLRSLYQVRDQFHVIDPDELALATSPCLYSIRASCEAYRSWHFFSFNLEAIESMVAGAAPNLRRVHVAHSGPANAAALLDTVGAPNIYWKGFSAAPSYEPPTVETTSAPRGRLDTLVIWRTTINPQYMSDWHGRSDFRHLRRLELNCFVTPEALVSLGTMAVDGKFERLQVLHIAVHSEDRDETSTLDPPVSRFLQALGPLSELCVRRNFGHLTFKAILARHGPTLRKLTLLPSNPHDLKDPAVNPPPRDCDTARAVADHCPRVSTLAFPVQRRHGSPEEVAVYRALGRIRRLRRATLHLECELPPEQSGAALDEHARACGVISNMAVDETLARGVFAEMLRGRRGEEEDGLARLVRVDLRPDISGGTWELGTDDLDTLCAWVGRKWNCVRDGMAGEVRVKSFANPTSLDYIRRETGGEDPGVDLDEEAVEVWNELWPPRGGDWRYGWSSLPLQTQDGLEDLGESGGRV